MKKIFLIPMMAIMCTIAAWGENVAKIGSKGYETVKAAIADAPDGVETQIDLIADVVEQLIQVPASKNIVLNLNSHSLTSDYWDDGEGYDENSAICNKGTLKVICEGTGIVSAPVTPNSCGFAIINYGDLIIDGGVFIGVNTPDWGGFGHFTNCVIWGNNGSNTIINGGTYVLANNPGIIWQGIMTCSPGGTLTINGGQFSSNQIGSDNDVLDNFLGEGCTLTDNVPFNQSYATWVSSVWAVTKESTTIGEEDVTISEDVLVESDVTIEEGVTITIDNGATLTIKNDLVFATATSQLIIVPGSTLIVGDEIVNASPDNIIMTMDERANTYSHLLIQADKVQENPAYATVNMKSVCNFDGSAYTWQRFAIPTYITSLTKADFVNASAGYQTALYGWDYDNDTWRKVGNSEVLLPFHCYEMTINADVNNADYTFECQVVGNGNPHINLHNEWNYLANSYTAPMDIKAWLNDLYTSDPGVTAALWIQTMPGSKGRDGWTSVAYVDVVTEEVPIESVKPMQAFILYSSGEKDDVELKYKEYVYDPIASNKGLSLAPARHNVIAEGEFTRANVIVETENGENETVKLYLGDNFSAGMDNGFDIPKYKNTEKFNFFAVTDLGNLERVASNNLDEIALVLETKDATSFTLKFESVSLEGYAIRDNLTEEVISITAENEYAFTAEANSTIADRFVVIKQQATSIENAAATAKKGIYSLTGVYMGENFHVLPAGVYIMNGKKVVK